MRLEEKISRWKELKKEKFLSDQDIEEVERLEEEIKAEIEGDRPRAKPNPHYKEQEDDKKKYRGIISGRILKWRDEKREKNKATPEKIEQLKLEYAKAKLESGIAEEKAKKNKHKWDKLEKMLSSGGMTDKERDKERDAQWKKINNYKR